MLFDLFPSHDTCIGWKEGSYARKFAYFGSVIPYVGVIVGGLLGKQLDMIMSIFNYDGSNRNKEKSWAEEVKEKFMKFAAKIVSSIPVIGGFLASYFDQNYNIDDEMKDYEANTGKQVSKEQMKLIQYGDVFDWMYSRGSGIPDMMGEIPLHRGRVGTSVYGTHGEAGEIIPIYNRWKQKNTKQPLTRHYVWRML